MPELIEISGTGEATTPTTPATQKITLSPVLKAVLVVGAIGLGLYLLRRIAPLKPKSTEVVGTFKYDAPVDGLGVIRRCRKLDKTRRRPAKDQKYCLYTKDGKRLLGRHPNRGRALKQERLIEMKKKGVI